MMTVDKYLFLSAMTTTYLNVSSETRATNTLSKPTYWIQNSNILWEACARSGQIDAALELLGEADDYELMYISV